MDIIEKIEITVKQIPLVKPYILSFGTIHSLDSIQVKLTLSDGRSTIAEVVPLYGYSDETTESILKYLSSVVPKLNSCGLSEAREKIAGDIPVNPFACSPVLTAIDLFDLNYTNNEQAPINFVVPAASADLQGLKRVLSDLPDVSSPTVKIKLSGDLSTDLACIDFIESSEIGHTEFRFDANQAFSLTAAETFYERVSSCSFVERIHYIEQPLPPEYWDGHAQLVKNFSVATMLDESIVTNDDIDKAATAGIRFVKFKLFKQGGIRELTRQIELACEREMHVVLGNGVASKISNDIENSIYSRYRNRIFGASEANGFLKTKDNY